MNKLNEWISKHKVLTVVIAFVLFAIIIGSMSSASRPRTVGQSSPAPLQEGDVVILKELAANLSILGTTRADYEEFLHASKINDRLGVNEMVRSERIFGVPGDSLVQILHLSDEYAEVRVIHAGSEDWLVGKKGYTLKSMLVK